MSKAEKNKLRRKYWRRFILLTIVFEIVFMFFNPFKKPLYINAPSNTKWAFRSALLSSGMVKDYKIVMTDSESANITIIEGGNNSEGYERIAFSPFICAGSEDLDESDMEDSNLLVKNRYDEDLLDIDVNKLISGVLEEDYWNDSDIEEFDDIIIYYPDKSTSYWYDFHNFMLVTVNNGKYPKTTSELVKAEETISKFMNSERTEAVADFDEKIDRNSGFSEHTLYLVPEVVAMNLSRDHNDEDVKLFYPIYTVNYNLYIKYDDIGEKMVDSFDNFAYIMRDFYYTLSNRAYRSEEIQKMHFYIRYTGVKNQRNTYEVINDLIFLDDNKLEDD